MQHKHYFFKKQDKRKIIKKRIRITYFLLNEKKEISKKKTKKMRKIKNKLILFNKILFFL